uniref:SusD/RagB family nutrient-binding outer membrane lipoprotein n=1 Tax=Alistipes putredinis TaxID=28117 RepID=UPI003FD73A5E
MKTTYNKICFGICLLGGALAGSCTGDYMDYNRNWAEVSPEETERDEYLVSSLLGGMQSNVIPVEEHLNQFTECLMGGVWGGYFADSQVWANSFSYFNPSQDWLGKMYLEIIPNVYSNWLSLQAATKDEAILAVGQIVKAAAFQRVTDTYGPIPYSRIGSDGKVTAPLDTQREVYEKIFEELDAAVATLTEHRTSSISAAADKVYSGDIEKWIKFANSLKLRMAMRLVYAAPATAEQRAKEAVDTTDGKLGVMASNDDNAQLSGINVNPFYKVAYEYNGGETRISADLLNYMKSWNDPRISAYAKKSTFTDAANDYWGLRIGNEYPITSGQAYSNLNIGQSDPLLWMNVSEVMFLRAEAALYGWDTGDTAENFYRRGVELSFAKWNAGDAASYLSSQNRVGAYNDPKGQYAFVPDTKCVPAWNSLDPELQLEQIITQKWIANFPLGHEAWAEFRRTGYPKLAAAPVNRSGGDVADGKFARRLIYPSDEYKTNGVNLNRAVGKDLSNGGDRLSTHVWWDCNPKLVNE